MTEANTTACGRPDPAPRFPEVSVRLVGEDSNTGTIMGRVTDAMAAKGVPAAERNAFRLAVLGCGSYAEVLRLVGRTVTVPELQEID